MMILQGKYSAVANLVVVVWICFMATECPCAPPPYVEPIIYVTFARWENRSFSPRVFYVMMSRQSQQSNLNQVQEDPYPYESPIPVHKLDEKPARPYFSVRNSFHNKKLQDEFSPTITPMESSNLGSIIVESRNHNNNNNNSTDSETLQFYRLTDNEEDKITFEPSSHNDKEEENKEYIIFKDNTSTSNRRLHPEGNKDKISHQSPNIDPCAFNKFAKGKSPRNFKHEEDHMRSLQFTLDLLHHHNDPSQDNFIFSPLSILNILALLFLGSSGATFQELSRLLQIGFYNDSTKDGGLGEKFHQDLSEILFFLNNCRHPKVLLETANKIFTDVKHPLEKTFEENARKFYDAEVTEFNFTNGGEAFKTSVNEWVREKTKGKITSIIDDPPSPLTTMALVNAVYFQGTWELPFAPHITRDGPFHVGEGNSINIKMMTNILEIPYNSTESYEIIRLPYKGGDTAMYIILPKISGVNGLRDMERKLSMESLNYQIKSMVNQTASTVTVKLPKMRVQSDGQVKDILSSLQIHSIFNPNSANFSEMSRTKGLYVSSLLHRAVVDISEKGTEAAAVSAATGDRIIDNNPISFNVNRPFIFFIYNNLADTVLFWGRIIRPEPLNE